MLTRTGDRGAGTTGAGGAEAIGRAGVPHEAMMPWTPISLTIGSNVKGAGPPSFIIDTRLTLLAVTVLLSAGSSAVKWGSVGLATA